MSVMLSICPRCGEILRWNITSKAPIRFMCRYCGFRGKHLITDMVTTANGLARPIREEYLVMKAGGRKS